MNTLPYAEKRYWSADGLSLYYRDYAAEAGARTAVLCLPGLTRNSKDFEDLALHLKQERRVLSPDLRGRGKSDYDSDFHHYVPHTYVSDIIALLAAESLSKIVIIGTSLGGILAMLFASFKGDALDGVVLNDVGPEIAPEGAARIADYVGKMPEISTWADAAAAQKKLNGDFFPDWTEDDWMDLARRTFSEDDNGHPVPDYDPGIGRAFREPPPGQQDRPQAPAPDLWRAYSALEPIPTLAIRGALSDILADETLGQMQVAKPDLDTVTIPRIGHPPTLNEPAARTAIDTFLARL